MQALAWFTGHAQNDVIWTDFTERVSAAYQIRYGTPPNGNSLDIYAPKYFTTSFLVSSITQVRSQRLGAALPIQFDSLRIYDNGEAAIYRRRPLTIFQK